MRQTTLICMQFIFSVILYTQVVLSIHGHDSACLGKEWVMQATFLSLASVWILCKV